MGWEKEKEIIGVRKLYLTQEGNSQTKLYYSLLFFSTSLILITIKEEVPIYIGYIGGILFLFIIFLTELMQKKRKRKFNKLIKYIKDIK